MRMSKRDLRLRKWEISDERYRELRYACLQYEQYRDWPGERGSVRRAAIEEAARRAGAGLQRCIIRNVTEGVLYEEMPVPCGRRQFYAARRRFFAELDRLL